MKAWMRHAARALARLYPDTARLFVVAPLVPGLVIVPEFIQHVVEISIGMFESREAFLALADHPLRMATGYAKIAGLVLAMLASARWWWTRRQGGHWADPRSVAWTRLLLGLVGFFGLPSLAALAQGRGPAWLAGALGWALSVAALPMLLLMLAGLFGDRRTQATAMWRQGWPALALTVALLVLAFAPGQWLHRLLHQWAVGAPPASVWLLMAFDALLVGFLAAGVGTALHLGYRVFVDASRGEAPVREGVTGARLAD